jgi:DNA-binding NarL/FixJ family response regulator
VEATRRIRAEYPHTRVVVLTTYSDDDSIINALQAGRGRPGSALVVISP